jgi:hypothetical protein
VSLSFTSGHGSIRCENPDRSLGYYFGSFGFLSSCSTGFISKAFSPIVYQSVTHFNDLARLFEKYSTNKISLATKIKFVSSDVNDSFIQRFPNLRSLELSDYFDVKLIPVTNDGMKSLINLISLRLDRHQLVTNDGIKDLTNITDLSLRFNNNITDE